MSGARLLASIKNIAINARQSGVIGTFCHKSQRPAGPSTIRSEPSDGCYSKGLV